MTASKPTDPRQRMGVYTSLESVPSMYRLESYAEAYEHRDLWREFVEAERLPASAREEQRLERFGREWSAHTAPRHHAFARPADVESWMADLLDEYAIATVYDRWMRLEAFYSWLQWHAEFPHRYNPVLMAAVEGAAGRTLWNHKMRSR